MLCGKTGAIFYRGLWLFRPVFRPKFRLAERSVYGDCDTVGDAVVVGVFGQSLRNGSGEDDTRLSVVLRLSSLRWAVCAVPDGRIVFVHRAACLCGWPFFPSGGIRAWGVAVAR